MLSEISLSIADFIGDPDNADQVGAMITSTISMISGLLTAVIGFGINSALARKADRRKYDLERQKERHQMDHERGVLQATLLAELGNVVRTYEGEIEFVDPKEGNGGTYVPIGFFEGIRTGRMNVGLLPPEQVRLVMDAYYTYQARTGYIARNGSGPIENSTIPYNFATSNRTWLINDLNDIIADARAAMGALEYHVNARA